MDRLRNPREMQGLSKSYSDSFFRHIWEAWSEDRRTFYEERISALLGGQPLTKQAHDQAVMETNQKFKRNASRFEAMRSAVNHPDELPI